MNYERFTCRSKGAWAQQCALATRRVVAATLACNEQDRVKVCQGTPAYTDKRVSEWEKLDARLRLSKRNHSRRKMNPLST